MPKIYALALPVFCGVIAFTPLNAIAGPDAGAKESGGLPQFDPSSFTSQAFWLVVIFTILYIFFSKKTLPEISGVIEARTQQIQGDIESAENLRKEAETVQQQYEEGLAKAREDATESYAEVENSIRAETEKKLKAFRDKASKKIDETETKIDNAQADAMTEMNAIAAEIASEAAKKIVGVSTDINQAKTVVQSLNKTSKKAA